MRGRRLAPVAAAAGLATLAGALCVTVRTPLGTTASTYAQGVAPPGVRVLIDEASPACPGVGFCYSPSDVSIGPGGTVSWFNNTGSGHSVTRCTPAACGGNGPGTGGDRLADSGEFGNGATYFFTFRGPGSYLYYCTVHGYKVMHGSVIVRDEPQATPTPARPLGFPLPTFPPVPNLPVRIPGVDAGRPHDTLGMRSS